MVEACLNKVNREPAPQSCVRICSVAYTSELTHITHIRATTIIINVKKCIGLESTMFKFQTPSVTHHSLGPTASWPGCSVHCQYSAIDASVCRKGPFDCLSVFAWQGVLSRYTLNRRCSSLLVTVEQCPSSVPASLANYCYLSSVGKVFQEASIQRLSFRVVDHSKLLTCR